MALPIIMQNLLSAAVNSADTLMLSFTGQNEMVAATPDKRKDSRRRCEPREFQV